jgi:glutathione S-transferase
VTALKLYDYELDDQCYKVRLLLSALGCPYVKVALDVHPGAEQRTPFYLGLNPLGELPIITEGDFVLYGAEAIMAYLARKYDRTRMWLPEDAASGGLVMQWLAFAGCDLKVASVARAHAMFEIGADAATACRKAHHALRVMEDHMVRQECLGAQWFTGTTPTIADIALFPSIALSRDFGIDHDEYPALRQWMARLRGIPGFMTMPGIPAYH